MQSYRHHARGVMRALKRSCSAPPVYTCVIPTWNKAASARSSTTHSFLLPREWLQHVVPIGQEDEWLSAANDQQGFIEKLGDWGRRTQVDVGDGHWES